MWLIFLVFYYYAIATIVGADFTPTPRFYITEIVKLFILIVCGEQIIARLSVKDLYYLLMLGAVSIVLHIYLFFDPLKDSGRFSGFYLDPNAAGFICLVGYSLSFAFKGRIKLIGQIIFTLMGLLTLSRTFIILLIITNLISIKISIKNAKLLGYGFIVILLLVSFNEVLPIKNVRLKQLSDFVNGKEVNTAEVNEDTRSDTWAIYYEYIIDKPFFGNGYNTFSGEMAASKINYRVGVHNTYLKLWGEAGIFVLLIFLVLIFKMLKDSWLIFDEHPYLFMAVVNLAIFLLTVHNYLDNTHRLMITMWLFFQIRLKLSQFKENKLFKMP